MLVVFVVDVIDVVLFGVGTVVEISGLVAGLLEMIDLFGGFVPEEMLFVMDLVVAFVEGESTVVFFEETVFKLEFLEIKLLGAMISEGESLKHQQPMLR